MSVEQMSIVWKKEVPSNRLGMLLALADHAHDDGSNVYPSAAHLAWKVGMSERHVRSVLKELHSENVLIKVKQATPQHPTVWRLNLDALADKRSWEEVREEHLSAKRSRGQAEPAAEARAEFSSAQDEEPRAEDTATHGRKSMQFRAEVQSSAEPSRGTVIEPSGSVEKTSFSTGDAAKANASDAAPSNKPENFKPISYRAYCHKRARELVKEAKEQSYAPDTLPDKTVNEWSAFYESAIARDGYTTEQCDAALWWLIRKASGAIEGEPQGWAAFGTGLRGALAEQDEAPNAQTELEKKRLEKENAEIDEMAREAARLMQRETQHG